MGDIPRNSPCPCGSGKKYKNCHLGREAELEPVRSARPLVLGVLALIALGLGALVFVNKGPAPGAAVGIGGLMVVGIAWAVWKPPPPGQGGDPGAINFGA